MGDYKSEPAPGSLTEQGRRTSLTRSSMTSERPTGYGDLTRGSMEGTGKDKPMKYQHDPKLELLDEKGMPRDQNEEYDEDGHVARRGTAFTASSHIITAVIGTGVLALGWALSWLGWVAGVIVLFCFAAITWFTCRLLIQCYRYPHPEGEQRNYTYIQAVDRYLGRRYTFWCGLVQYINMFGTGIGYTVTAGLSIQAIQRSNCFHRQDYYDPAVSAQAEDPGSELILSTCCPSPNPWLIMFGAIQIVCSQLQDFDRLWFISVMAAVSSFTYALIGLGLSVGLCAETARGNTGYNHGSAGGRPGSADALPAMNAQVDKSMSVLNALGAIAFAYSYSYILTEITDTVSKPEITKMYKANAISIAVTTFFYGSIGIISYAAFGDPAPDNLLSGFGFYRPYWLIDIANVAIFTHLVGAYQVWTQPLFAFIEAGLLSRTSPKSGVGRFMRYDVCSFPIPGLGVFRVNPFRLLWRTLYVVLTTVLAALLPFFGAIVGILGSIGFWPLTIFFPVMMHIVQKKIRRFSPYWFALQTLNVVCFFITIGALAGSVYGVVTALATGYTPFNSPCYTNDNPYN